MLSSTRFFHLKQEKTLPLQPLKSIRIELKNSHLQEALVLDNSKLREEVAKLRTKIDILYTRDA
jgi:phosphate uptake regulator